MRIVYFHYILIIFFLAGCAVNIIPQRITDPHYENPLLYGFNEIIDFNNIQVGDIGAAVTSALKDADNTLQEVLVVKSATCTFENTLLKMDNLYNTVSKVWNIIGLLSSTHPSEDIRNEADDNDLRMQKYMVEISINEDLYNIILTYSKSKEAQTLTGGRKRFLQSELRDFKRSGMEIKGKKREKEF